MSEDTKTELLEKNRMTGVYDDIVTYIRIVVMNIWIVIFVTVAGLIISYVALKAQAKIYEARTSAIVSPRAAEDLTSTLQSLDVLGLDVIGTYVQILSSQSMTRYAEQALQDDFSTDELRAAEVEIRPIENSSVILILIRSENSALAQALSNEVVLQTIEHNPVEALQQAYPIKVLDEAETPTDPVFPDIVFGLAMGGGASLIAGIGLIFLVDTFVKSRRKK